MHKITLPQNELKNLLSLLKSNQRFEVLAEFEHKEPIIAVLVLLDIGVSWGNFSRAAFCVVQNNKAGEVELQISHLNVQRGILGSNPLRFLDKAVEKEISRYVLENINGSKPLNTA